MKDSDIELKRLIPAEVISFWQSKGIKPGFSYLDVYAEEHSFAFTAAKFLREDCLLILQDHLDKAIKEGVPFEQFKKTIEPRLAEAGFWGIQKIRDPENPAYTVFINVPSRLNRIYDTNMRTARAQGQWERIQRNKATRPYLLYQVGPSERHRPDHLAWHGLLLPIDDPFWESHYPPNAWGCKCTVRAVSTKEADRLQETGISAPDREPLLDSEGLPTGHLENRRVKIRTETPKVQLVEFENKRTGEKRMVPKGIDPGFEATPLKNRLFSLQNR